MFHKKISQDSSHSEFGGVVPELASRLHAVALPRILEECRGHLGEVLAVAVTNEPGLNVTLLEGVMMAKALSLSLKVPLIAVNHLEAHIYSQSIEKESLYPLSALLVSGGHTMICEHQGYRDIKLIGESMDDSFGESFDKVAKMLGLGYPGGPIVESMAAKGDEERFRFTVPLLGKKVVEFSFSGLKNSVRLEIEKLGGQISDKDKSDICASFQRCAITHILDKCKIYLEKNRVENFTVVGGASANMALREGFLDLCNRYDTNPLFVDMRYTSDNAVMVGRCAVEGYKCGDFIHYNDIKTNPRVAL